MEGYDQSSCKNTGKIEFTHESGYISPKGLQDSNCIYSIQLAAGRRVNITIYNFPPKPGTSQSRSSACYEIGTIREGSVSKTLHKCLSDPRVKTLYVSNGNPVELNMMKNTADVAGNYLLHYQGYYSHLLLVLGQL